ncbi:MAG TPA: hypothetical protein DCW60_00805 [Sutterella sp.]|nr:hypothetical protein [Sutterella sp.]
MFAWFSALPVIVQTVTLLCISNLLMLCAWYGHLRFGTSSSLIVTIFLSWGIAFFEYIFMIPANRIGYQSMSVAQLKILQEVISLGIFVPFATFLLKETIKLNYLYAAVCMVFAVYFIFKD